MIDLFPFAGFPVGVLGLGTEGLTMARALALSEAEIWAWDDDAERRAAADAADIPLRDPAGIDWREVVSLAIEHEIAHGPDDGIAHLAVAAARAGGAEVIGDAELLARAQRDAAFAAVVARRGASETLDLFEHVFGVAGRETEVGGDGARPLLDLHPLELGGVYALAMPPARADLTLSITFDVAVFLDLGREPWPPFATREAGLAAARWVFHRQSGPKGAVLNVDDATGRALHKELAAAAEQIVIPVSGRSRAPGGVYVAGGVLVDDIDGQAVPVTALDLSGADDPSFAGVQAASAYAAAVVLDIPRHAAMASLLSFYID